MIEQEIKRAEVVRGMFKGAIVNIYFVNGLGNLDCRFAEDFGPHKAGAIIVLKPRDIRPVEFAEFSAANRRRSEAKDGFNHKLESWSLSDWFLAFIGEAGEAANIAKKLNRIRDGIPGNKETPDELRAKFRREIGDALIYLDLLAQSQGFDLLSAAVEAFDNKSAEIGYPHLLS